MIGEHLLQIIFENLLSFVLEHWVWIPVSQRIASCRMSRITLRVLDDLLDKIDVATNSEISRLVWLRDAIHLDDETEAATESNED